MSNNDTTETIEFEVTLNEKKVPKKIVWKASNLHKEWNESKSMLLSLWDPDKKNTLSLNLWTEEMPIHDMNLLFYQTIKQLADTFENATQNKKVASLIHDFSEAFAQEIEKDYKKK